MIASQTQPAPAPQLVVPARKKGPVTMAKAIPALAAAPETRRIAAAILEVLAGARTTGDAAKALAVSLPRYYALEARAIEGLVRACEPRKPGKTRSQAREVDRLQKEVARLERECARLRSLARAAQRTLGLAPPAASMSDPHGKRGKTRKRRPVARALLAAKALGERAPSLEKSAQTASPAAPRATP